MISQCQHCHKQQNIPDPYRGHEVKCQNCNEVFTAIESGRPAEQGIFYAFGRLFGSINRRGIYIKFLLFFAVITAVSFAAFKIGHKRGLKAGFYLAVDTMQSISKIQENAPSPSVLRPTEYAPPSPCSIVSVDYKTIHKDQIFHQISWQVKCQALNSAKVDVHVLFYDKDGFLLQKETMYDQIMEQSRTYVYSDTALFSPESATKIAFVNAKIESQ